MKFQNRCLLAVDSCSSCGSSHKEVLVHANGNPLKKRGFYVEKKNSGFFTDIPLSVESSSERLVSTKPSNERTLWRIDSLVDILSQAQGVQIPEIQVKLSDQDVEQSNKGVVVKEIHTKGNIVTEIDRNNTTSRPAKKNNCNKVVLKPKTTLASPPSHPTDMPDVSVEIVRTRRSKIKASSFDNNMYYNGKRNKATCSTDDINNVINLKRHKKIDCQNSTIMEVEKSCFDYNPINGTVKRGTLRKYNIPDSLKSPKLTVVQRKMNNVKHLVDLHNEPPKVIKDCHNRMKQADVRKNRNQYGRDFLKVHKESPTLVNESENKINKETSTLLNDSQKKTKQSDTQKRKNQYGRDLLEMQKEPTNGNRSSINHANVLKKKDQYTSDLEDVDNDPPTVNDHHERIKKADVQKNTNQNTRKVYNERPTTIVYQTSVKHDKFHKEKKHYPRDLFEVYNVQPTLDESGVATKDSIIDFLVNLYEDNIDIERDEDDDDDDYDITLQSIYDTPQSSCHDNLSEFVHNNESRKSTPVNSDHESKPERKTVGVTQKRGSRPKEILVSDGPYNYYMSKRTGFPKSSSQYSQETPAQSISDSYHRRVQRTSRNLKHELLNTLREQLAMRVEVEPEPDSIYETLQGMMRKKKKQVMKEEAEARRLGKERAKRSSYTSGGSCQKCAADYSGRKKRKNVTCERRH